MRSHDERVVARMDRELVDPHRREVGLQPPPALPTVEGHEDSRFGANVQHVGVLEIFGECARHLTSEPIGHAREGGTGVLAHPGVWPVVVFTMVVDGHIHRGRVEPGRHHARDEPARREPGDAARDVRPRSAVVPRHLHVAVVGAGEVHPRLPGRLGEGDDGRPLRNAVVARNVDVGALHSHRGDGVAVRVAREVGTDDRPRVAAVGRLEHAVRRREQRAGIVRREHQRRVPVPAVRLAGIRRWRHVAGVRPDVLRFARDLVLAGDVTVLRLGVHNPRIAQVGNRDESVTALNLEPVVVHDALRVPRTARATPAVIVLHAAADVVRRFHVEPDAVEQAYRQIRDEGPGSRPVIRNRDAAVVALDHVIGVRGIDPERVQIVVNHQRRIGLPEAPAIHGHLEADATHVDAIGTVRVDAHLAEVHRTRVVRARPAPRHAAVVGAVGARPRRRLVR